MTDTPPPCFRSKCRSCKYHPLCESAIIEKEDLTNRMYILMGDKAL